MTTLDFAVRRVVLRTGFFVLLIAVCGVALFPLYWMALTTLKSTSALFNYPPDFLPHDVSFDAYARIFANTDLGTWMANTVIIAGTSTFLAMLIGTSGAFALSRFTFRGRHLFAITILTTQMIPVLVLILPMFKIFVFLGLVDTLTGLILGNFAFALPVVTWMMKAIFDTIPKDLEDAARIDGASWPTILVRVIGPIALPGLVATSIYAFIESWDEFLLARTIVTSSDNWPLSVGLASFIGIYATPWDELMAAAVIFALPPLILFMVVQKYFIAGLGSGAVKG